MVMGLDGDRFGRWEELDGGGYIMGLMEYRAYRDCKTEWVGW